jgi:ubiquinone/menaquinone biosynthesis C-methylase UbiE
MRRLVARSTSGVGSGRDAVYLTKRGWQVTAVDAVENALASARQRAADEGVEVQWVLGDVAELVT